MTICHNVRGIITRASTKDEGRARAYALVEQIPGDRMLIETDGPFVTVVRRGDLAPIWWLFCNFRAQNITLFVGN